MTFPVTSSVISEEGEGIVALLMSMHNVVLEFSEFLPVRKFSIREVFPELVAPMTRTYKE